MSWYDKRTAPAKGVRVSFLDPATKRYRHVLLVYPTTAAGSRPTRSSGARRAASTRAGSPGTATSCTSSTPSAASACSTYANLLDLAASPNGDTGDATQVGRHGGKYYGFGYRYVLPQAGAWVNAAGPDNDGDFTCAADGAPKFSSIGLDRAAARLVTSEYCDSGAFGRVARWPLAGDDLQPGADGLVHAAEVQRLPVHNVQGAVSNGGTWYLSRSRGSTTGGQLIPATPGADGSLKAGAARPAGIGPEDLSYWPGRDEIWTVTEHAGRRMLYGVPATG